MLGLWNVVVDAGDIASTALPTSYLVDAIYEGVTGEERPSLLERNDLARGAVETATDAVNYVGDTVTGNKSWEQIKSDAKSVGQGLYDDYIDPFVKDAQYDQDNLLKGGLWTRSEEQSYEKGQNEFKKDMVVAEVAVSALSAGTGTAVTRTVKMADKLDGPNGKKKSGDHEGNGKGVLLPNSSIDELMHVILKDGKLKTAAKSFAESMIKLEEIIKEFHKLMKGEIEIRVGVMWTNPIDGGGISWPVVFIEKRNSHGNGNGGGGGGNHRRSDNGNEGTGNVNKPERIIDDLYNRTKNIRDQIKQKADEIRKSDAFKNLSSKQRRILEQKLRRLETGNLASAKVDISGIEKGYISHSQINTLDDLFADLDNFTHLKNDRVFETYVEDGFPRYQDTEAKILEDIASKIKDPTIKGEIDFFSHFDVCQSCTNLIFEFRRKFPNIKLNVYTNSMR
ncbi:MULTISPECIES: deaminase domain-containing protein [unclassified Brevibacillus]|uniref:deaminase domain-containing protein n=1 Tax=unclassified Brevibacillus TaxID=2684853 RepID=UPI0035613DBE